MSKSRIFLLLLAAFIGGVGVRSFIPISYIFIWVFVVLGCAVIIIGISRHKTFWIIYGFLILAFALGIFRFDRVVNSKYDPVNFYDKQVTLVGIISEEPEISEKAQKIKVEVESINNFKAPSNFLVLLTTRKYPEFKMGDELKIEGRLERPQNTANFDYVSYLARENIFSTLLFPKIELIAENRGNKFIFLLLKFKNSFEEKIDYLLPEPHSSFLKGLLFGDRESLPKDFVENLKRTGTTHIVALSGYNITLVGRFLFDVLLFLTVPFRAAFWASVGSIIIFIFMTGASPSVVRAGIMGILVLVAWREGRMYHMTNALVFAAAAMIFYNPRLLRFDAAFQLSFLSTFGLVYLSPHVESILDKIRIGEKRIYFLGSTKVKGKLFRQILVETLSAQLMVLPLLIYLFGRVSIISPIANIFVLVAIPYSMALGFLAGVFGFIWLPLGQIFGWMAWALLEYKLRMIDFFASIPLASFEVGKWAAFPILAFYIYLFIYLWTTSRKKLN